MLLLLLLLSLYKLHVVDLVLLALGQSCFLLLLSQNTLETLDLIGDVHDEDRLWIHLLILLLLLLSCGRRREVLAC